VLPVPFAVSRAIAKAQKKTGRMPLSEIESKKLIRAYGLKTPKERLATSGAEAMQIARDIGLPVVLKAAGAELLHKSDLGGVVLNNTTLASVRDGFAAIQRNVTAKAKGTVLDGVLVAEQIKGDIELTIGASRDPEMGPFLMFGSGGVALELYRDVAFSAPTLDVVSANALIDRTAASQLINGYRGALALDRSAVIKALIAVSRLAIDLGDNLDSIDVNPFVLRRRGGVALDALAILYKR
jgi:succinyl-CoA synthetase beta subunit